MPPNHASFLDTNEATAINAVPKFINDDVEWKNLPLGSQIFGASMMVCGGDGATIPGLTVELDYSRSIVPGQYKFKLTLFVLRGTKKLRSLQVEVIPPERVKHRENGVPIAGPHEHVGEKGFPVDEEAISFGTDYQKWFQYFLKKANITYKGKYSEPDPPNPQGALF